MSTVDWLRLVPLSLFVLFLIGACLWVSVRITLDAHRSRDGRKSRRT